MTASNNTAAATIKPFTADDSKPLPPAAWPLPKADWGQYVDTPQMVTFTAKVSLDDLVTRSGFGLAILMEDAFNHEAILYRPTFCVVGHEQGEAGQAGANLGYVDLQVICTLCSDLP